MSYMTQDQKFVTLTAKLPAWKWRLILYAVELHAENRDSVGHSEVADTYRDMASSLADELGVDGSGDLPVYRPKD